MSNITHLFYGEYLFFPGHRIKYFRNNNNNNNNLISIYLILEKFLFQLYFFNEFRKKRNFHQER
jgi:hypothetical protein